MARQYEKLELLGSGSYGKAWLVNCSSKKRQAVLKEIKIDCLSDKEIGQALVEVKVLAKCRHVNIISYCEAFQSGQCLNIVMEFADNGDMQKKILDQRGIHFDSEVILDWFIQICFALKYLHSEHILHRDLKPQNLFLTSDGVVKVGDFGIARILHDTADHAVTAIGTPYYLSPEICHRHSYNSKSDLWSAGCVLYELCCLRVPFQAPNLPLLVLKITEGAYDPIPSHYGAVLEDLVTVLLKTDPSHRPTAQQVLKVPALQPHVRLTYAKCLRHKDHRYRHRLISWDSVSSVGDAAAPKIEKVPSHHRTFSVKSPLVRRLSVASPKLQAVVKRQRSAQSAEPITKTGRPPVLNLHDAVSSRQSSCVEDGKPRRQPAATPLHQPRSHHQASPKQHTSPNHCASPGLHASSKQCVGPDHQASPKEHTSLNHHANPGQHASSKQCVGPDHQASPKEHASLNHHASPDQHASSKQCASPVHSASLKQHSNLEQYASYNQNAFPNQYASLEQIASSNSDASPNHYVSSNSHVNPEQYISSNQNASSNHARSNPHTSPEQHISSNQLTSPGRDAGPSQHEILDQHVNSSEDASTEWHSDSNQQSYTNQNVCPKQHENSNHAYSIQDACSQSYQHDTQIFNQSNISKHDNNSDLYVSPTQFESPNNDSLVQVSLNQFNNSNQPIRQAQYACPTEYTDSDSSDYPTTNEDEDFTDSDDVFTDEETIPPNKRAFPVENCSAFTECASHTDVKSFQEDNERFSPENNNCPKDLENIKKQQFISDVIASNCVNFQIHRKKRANKLISNIKDEVENSKRHQLFNSETFIVADKNRKQAPFCLHCNNGHFQHCLHKALYTATALSYKNKSSAQRCLSRFLIAHLGSDISLRLCSLVNGAMQGGEDYAMLASQLTEELKGYLPVIFHLLSWSADVASFA